MSKKTRGKYPEPMRSTKSIKRREFISATLAGAVAAGASLTGDGITAIADEKKNTSVDALDPLAIVPLGKNLKTTRIGLGTGMKAWERTSNQTKLGQKHFDSIFHYAYEQGIRLFDLADLYGTHSYAPPQPQKQAAGKLHSSVKNMVA